MRQLTGSYHQTARRRPSRPRHKSQPPCTKPRRVESANHVSQVNRAFASAGKIARCRDRAWRPAAPAPAALTIATGPNKWRPTQLRRAIATGPSKWRPAAHPLRRACDATGRSVATRCTRLRRAAIATGATGRRRHVVPLVLRCAIIDHRSGWPGRSTPCWPHRLHGGGDHTAAAKPADVPRRIGARSSGWT